VIDHSVKVAVDDDISVLRIFHSSTPYWAIMLIGVVLLVWFPKIAT